MFLWALCKNAILFSLIGVSVAILGALLPDRLFEKDAFPYRSYAWEKGGRFYQKVFRVGKWKERLPDASRFVRYVFCKKRMQTLDAEYLSDFIRETRRAELSHWFLICISPTFFLWNTSGWGVAMCLCGIFGNIPFIIAQRYNRPRLLRLLRSRRVAEGRTGHSVLPKSAVVAVQ
jgi:glycosyl-4,4'-diaponeurosporenoate acyltransferase